MMTNPPLQATVVLLPQSSAALAASTAAFNARALTYESAANAWHMALARDFMAWISPQPGEAVLDLACGTGYVTLLAAQAVGAVDGIVVGVDASVGMLSVAQSKRTEPGAACVQWVEHDVTDLSLVEAVQNVVRQRGGFDVVSCCSALTLLHGQADALRYWTAALLRPGGRIIVDVPTQHPTIQRLFTVEMRDALGLSVAFERKWIKGLHSLEGLFEDAGLVVDKAWLQKSYVPEHEYEADQADEMFEAAMARYCSYEKVERMEEARKVWADLWKQNLRADGKFWDGHPLYVAIGRKPFA